MIHQGADSSPIPAHGYMPASVEDMTPALEPCAVCGWRPSADRICQSCAEIGLWRFEMDADTSDATARLNAQLLGRGYYGQWLQFTKPSDRINFAAELNRGVFYSDPLSRTACFIALCLIAANSVDPRSSTAA